jgi:oxygen-independent coproporphyrinogen-3 oxidase
MIAALGYAVSTERLQKVRALVDKQRPRRQSNKVLHGHPSPLFWLEREIPVGDVMALRQAANRRVPKRVNLYVATPYCLPTDPDRCGFCLFPSEVYQGRQQLDTYLGYLQREGEMYQPYFDGTEIGSIYFGGGTSNLYKLEQYDRLMGIVRRVLGRLPDGIEITLEGIPQLFTLEKLTAMRSAGMNRISIGVQQLDDEMIRMSGRKQKAAQVFQAIAWCRELSLPCSVDLIFGWPRQTPERMLRDLEAIVASGVQHITHYELNVAGRTDFARNRRHELPSTDQNLELYRLGRDFLRSHGYRQVTAYDWERTDDVLPGDYRYEQTWHRPLKAEETGTAGVDLWGWGFAGISFFLGAPETPGWALMNATHVDEYFRRLDAGEFPIERGFHYGPADLRLTVLFQMLQAMRVSRAEYTRLFRIDLVEEYAEIWEALAELGWVNVTADAVELVGDGVFYTPLIQGVLAAERMEDLRRGKPQAGTPALAS